MTRDMWNGLKYMFERLLQWVSIYPFVILLKAQLHCKWTITPKIFADQWPIWYRRMDRCQAAEDICILGIHDSPRLYYGCPGHLCISNPAHTLHLQWTMGNLSCTAVSVHQYRWFNHCYFPDLLLRPIHARLSWWNGVASGKFGKPHGFKTKC